jgi:hypothetical protein
MQPRELSAATSIIVVNAVRTDVDRSAEFHCVTDIVYRGMTRPFTLQFAAGIVLRYAIGVPVTHRH